MTLAVAYDQGQDQRWTLNQETKDGACHALSIHWILNQDNNTDFFNWLQTDQQIVDKVLRIMQQQQKAFQKGGLEMEGTLQKGLIYKMAWIRHKVEGNCSLKMKSEYEDSLRLGVKDLQGLAAAIKPAKGLNDGTYYNYVNLNLRLGGAHAIATKFTKSSAKCTDIKVFDPNEGEYHCTDLNEYMKDFKKTMKFYDPRSIFVVTFA